VFNRFFIVPMILTTLFLGGSQALQAGSRTLKGGADQDFSVVKVSKLSEDWEVTVTSGIKTVGSVTFSEYFATKDPTAPVELGKDPYKLKGMSWFYGMQLQPTAGTVYMDLSFRKAKAGYPTTDKLEIRKLPKGNPTFKMIYVGSSQTGSKKPKEEGPKCKVDPSMYMKVPELSARGSVKNPFLTIGLD
jgi:hypothetical protein